MSVSVRKSPSELVRPSEPVSMGTSIKLSSFDRGLDKIQVAALLMFEHPIDDAASTIRRALSQSLVHYYPIAGRITAGADDGEVHTQCNGEGVAFVSASADCALKEVMLLDGSSGERNILDELVIFRPAEGFGSSADPLLMLQVTEFSCGGFVLRVTWNHAIADAAGMAQFLQAVAELTRGFAMPSIVPIRWDDSLPMSSPQSSEPPPQQQPRTSQQDVLDNLSGLEIPVPSRLIERIKAEFSNRFTGQPCTMFEVASAVLWQCRTRAIMCNPDTPALFLYSANVRKIVGAKEGYYGNCMTMQLVMATSRVVANGDIVKMIKDSKEKIADKFNKNEGGNDPQQEEGQMQQLVQLGYSMLIVTSWVNLGFDEVDFGSGRPARMIPYGKEKPPFPFCVMCPPWQAEDSVNLLSSMLKEEHVDAFLAELAKLA